MHSVMDEAYLLRGGQQPESIQETATEASFLVILLLYSPFLLAHFFKQNKKSKEKTVKKAKPKANLNENMKTDTPHHR